MKTLKTEVPAVSISSLELDCLRLENEINIGDVEFLSRSNYGITYSLDEGNSGQISRAIDLISRRETLEMQLAGMLSTGSDILQEKPVRETAKKGSSTNTIKSQKVNRQAFSQKKWSRLMSLFSDFIPKSFQKLWAIIHKR